MMIIGLIVLLLLGVCGVAVSRMRSKPSGKSGKASAKHHGEKEEASADTEESDSGSDEESSDEEEVKTVPVKMEEFVLNLADTDQQHYIKTEITLQMKGEAKGEEGPYKEEMPKMRDAVIMTMSKKTFAELLKPNGKEELKAAIKKAVNKVMKKKLVKEVYFMSFAMQ